MVQWLNMKKLLRERCVRAAHHESLKSASHLLLVFNYRHLFWEAMA
jgi:hypothetical protein